MHFSRLFLVSLGIATSLGISLRSQDGYGGDFGRDDKTPQRSIIRKLHGLLEVLGGSVIPASAADLLERDRHDTARVQPAVRSSLNHDSW